MNDYIDSDGNRRKDAYKFGNYRGIDNYKVSTPRVVKMAKNHFNCSTADGIELENAGRSDTK